MPMLRERSPHAAMQIMARLTQGDAQAGCLAELQNCRMTLLAYGFRDCPSWQSLWDGARPSAVLESEPGEYRHGWQYWAASNRERHFREHTLLPYLDPTRQALLESQSGRLAGRHLQLLPVSPETTYTCERFRALLQRRLRCPLQLAAGTCNGRSCRCRLDAYGDHGAACGRVCFGVARLLNVCGRVSVVKLGAACRPTCSSAT